MFKTARNMGLAMSMLAPIHCYSVSPIIFFFFFLLKIAYFSYTWIWHVLSSFNTIFCLCYFCTHRLYISLKCFLYYHYIHNNISTVENKKNDIFVDHIEKPPDSSVIGKKFKLLTRDYIHVKLQCQPVPISFLKKRVPTLSCWWESRFKDLGRNRVTLYTGTSILRSFALSTFAMCILLIQLVNGAQFLSIAYLFI